MKKIDLNSILPNEEDQAYEEAKKELPYGLLIDYAEAFNKKYKGKLKAYITESSYVKSHTNDNFREALVIALSFEAAIGQGYLYRLLEVEQLQNTIFPVKVKVFKGSANILGTYKDFNTFYTQVIGFLDSSIVKGIIINLLGMVDLYNETRNEKFEEEEQK